MVKFISVVLICSPISGLQAKNVFGQAPDKPGRSVVINNFGDETRRVVMRFPQDYGKKAVPMVLLLHGFTGRPEDIENYSGFVPLSESENFALVIPEGTGQSLGWNTGFLNLGKSKVDDIGYLEALVNECIKSLKIDNRRIYIAGHSNGAMMANALGARMSDKIAAIGCFAGIIGIGEITGKNVIPKPSNPISVIHIHGREDNVIAFDSKSSALLKGIPAPRAIEWWAESVGIKGKAEVTQNGRIETTTYKSDEAEVTLMALSGWMHQWPVGNVKIGNYTSPIDGATEMWNFFKRHRS